MKKDKVLYVTVEYDIDHDKFNIKTNAKDPVEIISNFIRSQINKGEDSNPANETNPYIINISLDLSFDSFKCIHNCGNKGLREGILMHYLNTLI